MVKNRKRLSSLYKLWRHHEPPTAQYNFGFILIHKLGTREMHFDGRQSRCVSRLFKSTSSTYIYKHEEKVMHLYSWLFLIATINGSGPSGRWIKFRVLDLSSYPGTKVKFSSFRNVARTITVSCSANCCPTEDLAPAENASIALRLPAGIVPDVSVSVRSCHPLPARVAHRCGRKLSACGKFASS